MSPFRRILPFAVLAVPAWAQAQIVPMTDKATGLTLAPPPGYTARRVTPNRGQAVRFEVKTPADTDTGCQVAYSPAPQNNRFSQTELDTVIRGTEWQETARSAIAGLYDVKDSTVLDAKGRAAFVMVADFQERPQLPARARDMRTFFAIQETPRGRISTVCVGERLSFEARRAEFAAIATGATLP